MARSLTNGSHDGALSAFYYKPFHPLKTISANSSSLKKAINLSQMYSSKQECYTSGVEYGGVQ